MSSCKHENFKSEVVIGRDEGVDHIMVSLTVSCADCFKPLVFTGLDYGMNPSKPTVSLDGMEARLNAKLLS